ncbi:MAG: DNA cytosine methyltransferase [Spirochaetia bacterium]|nr:DNA cytosine methyltransferase [Spirochaetia bacterium]
MGSNNKVIFELGELFSGPGGLALGAINAKIENNRQFFSLRHKWANDIDKNTCETYRKNICPDSEKSVICGDIRKLNIKSLPKIDAFAFGFPCNDFSIVGEHKGINGNYGPLYSYGVQILNTFRPKFFVAENVKGITSANEGQAFKIILEELSTAGNGYNLNVHLYKFEDYGVPQKRHRIIIVGIDKNLGKFFRVPAPITKNKHIPVKNIIEDLINKSNIPNHELTIQSKKVIERLKYIKPGKNVWNSELPEHLRLNVKGAKLSQIYRRLHPDEPAYTITGSGGGGTHGYHYQENRALTNRERARIQTFPDNFEFYGSKESVRRQIGMAVSPKIAQIIFESILKTFAGINYKYVESNYEFFQNNLFNIQKTG